MEGEGKRPRRSPGSGAWLRAREVAEMLGVCAKTVRRLSARGALPRPRVLGPRTSRWSRAEIEKVLGVRP
jgi:excisionase family DNA binding protein